MTSISRRHLLAMTFGATAVGALAQYGFADTQERTSEAV